ncbi:MAG: bla [Burkholderiales bacterium]|jgi:beta-lactamase class A|nr:bla [Burkholderiales bacterium]
MIYKQIYLFLAAISLNSFSNANNLPATNMDQINDKLAKLEASFDGKIGVYAVDTNNGQIIAHRADECFPVQSTMKMIGAAALLKRSETNKRLLQEKIHYTQSDLIGFSHVTRHNLSSGMTLKDLAEASVTYSDDTAINVIMRKFGGPKFATDFAHSIGNSSYNVTHYDGYMNSNPKSQDDTATPKDMAISVQKLLLGDTLTKTNQQQLLTWMRNSVTSYKMIRTGAPIGFAVADKSGGDNDYGVRNDIGIMWSPACKPIILAIYTIRNKKEEKSRDDIVAATTTAISDEFAKQDSCFKE